MKEVMIVMGVTLFVVLMALAVAFEWWYVLFAQALLPPIVALIYFAVKAVKPDKEKEGEV